MFKWAELNDISAALQSLPVGIHLLSSQLPYGMLAQQLGPSDQQLHPLNGKKMQPVYSPICTSRITYWWQHSAITQMTLDSDSHLIFLIKLIGLSELVVGNSGGFNHGKR